MNSVFSVLLHKELRALMSDGRLVVLLLLWCTLSLSAAIVSSLQRGHTVQVKSQVSALIRAQWDRQGDKHPHRGAHFGLYALRHDTALAAFDPGVGTAVGQALYLEPHRRNVPMFSDLDDLPASAGLVRLTPAFLMEVLLPLLVCVLAFASVTLERESGTLRMLHGVGLPRLRWLLAKVAAVAGCSVASAAPALVAPMLLSDAGITPEIVLRGSLIGASLAVLVVTHAAIAVSISCWCKEGRTALLAVLAFWAATALVLPRLATDFALQRMPSPEAAAFWAAIGKDIRDGLPGEATPTERLKEFERRTLQAHGVSRVDELPVGFLALRRLFRDAEADRVHDRHFARLWSVHHQQQRLALLASGPSPTVAWRAVSMAIAATDLNHEQHFQDEAERYRRDVNNAIDRWDAVHSRGLVSYEERYAGAELWESMPRFEHRQPPLADALRPAAPAMGILAAWMAGALSLLLLSARGLKP